MKQNLSDFLLIGLALCVIVAIVVIACVGCHETEETERAKVKAGLVKKPIQYEHWEKP